MQELFFSSAGGGVFVLPIPCLRDNYAYLVWRDGASDCLVVDPSEATPVRTAVETRGLRLLSILNTHHHWDHVGGNAELIEWAGSELRVFAHASERSRVPGFAEGVVHQDVFEAAGLKWRALHVPGHTAGAVCYVGADFCFTGDTLFCAGCGRLFEGTPAQMFQSLNETLGALPDDMIALTGHEYTEPNLRFAQSVAPHIRAIRQRAEEVGARRQQGLPCAHAPLGRERQTNPFLLCHDERLRRELDMVQASDEEVFRRLRELKDSFS